ncbi:MAG: phosphotransferase, partial [Parvularculaceae bacterium]
PAGAPEIELYESAIDALITLRSGAPTPPASGQYTMLAYDRLAMEAEVSLLIDWYWPFRKGEKPADDQRAEYLGGWRAALESLPPPSLIVLRDYHAENLLWLPERKATDRVGVIDFQDGLVGNPAYDLVSLLEDARRDVAPELSTAMIARYSERAKAFTDFDEASFRRDYAILGAQRNAKILGIFARLIMRDGKKRYEQFFPRVEAHFRGDLVHPELKTVAAFLRANFGDLF